MECPSNVSLNRLGRAALFSYSVLKAVMSHNPFSFKLKEMEAEGGLKIALDQQFGDF